MSDSLNIPPALYHGSSHAIRKFRPLRGHDLAGIYLTPSFDDAHNLAEMDYIEEGDEATVMTCRLTMKNPLVMKGIASHAISVAQRDEFLARGYDGVI